VTVLALALPLALAGPSTAQAPSSPGAPSPSTGPIYEFPNGPLTANEKKRLRQQAEDMEDDADNMASTGLSLSWPDSAILGQAALGMRRSARRTRRMADDPPDSRFEQVVLPHYPGSPSSSELVRLDASSGRDLAAYLRSLSLESGRMSAIVSSIERSAGAHLAGQPRFQLLQMQAAGRHATRLVATLTTRLERHAALERSLRRGLTRRHAPNAITAGQTRALQRRVRAHGLPTRVMSTLTRLGATRAEIDELTGMVLSFKARRVTLDELLADAFGRSLEVKERIIMLSGFARRVRECALCITPVG
jgi:hypothetical protein